MPFLHGCETIDLTKGPRPIRGVKTAVIGLIGTAPLLDCLEANSTTNEIKLITSDKDAALYFGSIREGFTIPQALDAIFDQGSGAIVLAINVLDPDSHKTTVTAESATFDADGEITLAHPQVSDVVITPVVEVADESKTFPEGGTVTVAHHPITNLVVKVGTSTKTITTDYTVDLATGVITRVGGGGIDALATILCSYHYNGTAYTVTDDYTVNAADGVITLVEDGDITPLSSALVAYTWIDPSKVDAADIIGEVVAETGIRTGLQAFLDTYSLFGFFPKILIAPAYSTQTSVVSALDVIAGKVRAVCPVDAPSGTIVADAITGRGPLGDINFNTASGRIILCYPYLKRYDAATDADVLEPFSQRLAGVMAAKDIEKGFWWSPSNSEIKGITGVERNITFIMDDPACEANLLNEAGIVTVINTWGSGFKIWGNSSAKRPSATTPDIFVCVQRVKDQLHESVIYFMLQMMDAPIDNAWIDSVKESVNGYMRTLIMRGALIDGSCIFDPARNPVTELAQGIVTFGFEFMPPTPAEHVIFESYININLLSKLYA